MFRIMQNRDVLDVDVELDVDEELDIHVDLDVDVEDGAVFGVLSHRPLRLQHDILPAVCYFAFMLQSIWIAAYGKDLKQDVVEEKGAEHAAQLLPLVDDGCYMPFGTLTIITCLMSHRARAWQRSSLLASCSPRMSRPPFNWLLTFKISPKFLED